MSTHTNYTRLTASILSLKRYFPNVTDKKYDQFKEVLISCKYDSLEESWEHVPETKDIATALGISKQRVYKLIKGLYAELKIQFDAQNPIEIQRVVHLIYIGVPYQERNEYPNQKYAQEELYRSTNIYMQLPVIPRIGEHIDLSFIEDKKFTVGYVHDVRHQINGDSMIITVYAHPYHNYYFGWQKLKEEYEWRERVKNSKCLSGL